MNWPVFVISLADAHERRLALQTQCDAFAINVEFVEAVDGRQGLPPEFEHLVDRGAARANMRRDLTNGEFACALSHQMIYQRILRDGLPGAIILEDDAVLTPGFVKFITDEGYKASDFVQLDYLSARYYPWTRQRDFGGYRTVPIARNACLASAYSVSAKAAEFILNRSCPIPAVADWPCDLQPLRPLITLPRLVTQSPQTDDQSALRTERAVLQRVRSRRGMKRFANAAYWRQWLMKRLTRETSW